jgi:hypothetical protein
MLYVDFPKQVPNVGVRAWAGRLSFRPNVGIHRCSGVNSVHRSGEPRLVGTWRCRAWRQWYCLYAIPIAMIAAFVGES